MSPQTVHQFAEKVALVSDAASPVGRAVAMQLALQGSYVIGLFPDAADAAGAAVNELVELGTLAHGLSIDGSTFAGANEAAEKVESIFGRLDLLVNCLKPQTDSSFEVLGDADFASVVGRGMASTYFLTRAVYDLMNGRPKPKIVNVAWEADVGSEPLFESVRSAIVGLTTSFAAAFPKHFRVNCVLVREPGANEATQENGLIRPAGSVAPDDVARAVLFLLSSESKAVNGQVIRTSGL